MTALFERLREDRRVQIAVAAVLVVTVLVAVMFVRRGSSDAGDSRPGTDATLFVLDSTGNTVPAAPPAPEEWVEEHQLIDQAVQGSASDGQISSALGRVDGVDDATAAVIDAAMRSFIAAEATGTGREAFPEIPASAPTCCAAVEILGVNVQGRSGTVVEATAVWRGVAADGRRTIRVVAEISWLHEAGRWAPRAAGTL